MSQPVDSEPQPVDSETQPVDSGPQPVDSWPHLVLLILSQLFSAIVILVFFICFVKKVCGKEAHEVTTQQQAHAAPAVEADNVTEEIFREEAC